MASAQKFLGTKDITPELVENHLWWWRHIWRVFTWSEGEWVAGKFNPPLVQINWFSYYVSSPRDKRVQQVHWVNAEAAARIRPGRLYSPACLHNFPVSDISPRDAQECGGDLDKWKRLGEKRGLIELKDVTIDVCRPGEYRAKIEQIAEEHRKKYGLSVYRKGESRITAKTEANFKSVFRGIEFFDKKFLLNMRVDNGDWSRWTKLERANRQELAPSPNRRIGAV